MAENSKIEWTDHTFNPWIGCTETSPACDNCYARVQNNHRKWTPAWGAGTPRHRTGKATWRKPIALNAAARMAGTIDRMFCASLADWADEEVPEEWRDELELVVDATHSLEWLLLSKRHNLVNKWARARKPKPNVRLGFTVENEEWARIRLPYLGRLSLAGWKTFISYEPALGPVNWDLYLDRDGMFGGCFDWVICGGESAKGKHRPMDLDWARSLRDACRKNDVPFFFKQIDKVQPIPSDLMIREYPQQTQSEHSAAHPNSPTTTQEDGGEN